MLNIKLVSLNLVIVETFVSHSFDIVTFPEHLEVKSMITFQPRTRHLVPMVQGRRKWSLCQVVVSII